MKKQRRRIMDAVETYRYEDRGDYAIESFSGCRKPLRGKSARYLIGRHYWWMESALGAYWTFSGRPRFADGRKYAIHISENDMTDTSHGWMQVCRYQPEKSFCRVYQDEEA